MTAEPTTSPDATLGRIEARLSILLPEAEGQEALNGAMADGVLTPGKRLRPLMSVIVAEDLGGDSAAAVDIGCAIEMVHAASLMLDDLPCMDDADMRRGRPSVHRRHGEDAAVLASVALLSHAYGTIAAAPGVGAETRVECIAVLARAVGAQGLVAGQFQDLRGGQRARPLGEIVRANGLKTGALFSAAVEAGAIIAGADAQRRPLVEFAHELGQAFQLLDDLLDREPNAAMSGKTPGRDERKSTVVSLLGHSPVRKRIERHVGQAHIHLEAVFGPGSRLAGLVDRIFERPRDSDLSGRSAHADALEQEAGAR